ncbi:MAG: hypothetical protein II386_00395, partial [Bacteroidaceae bacterium]|nr:hypothetical protein [Bacteroidaceae bacterium]
MKNLKYRLLYLLLGIALVAFAAPALTLDLWTVDTEGWTLTAKHEKAMPSTASAQAQHEDAVNVEALPTETASPLLPPDSLSRKVKKTDYPQGDRPKDYPFDLTDPENLKPEVGEWDEKLGMFRVGAKLGDNFLSTPYL